MSSVLIRNLALLSTTLRFANAFTALNRLNKNAALTKYPAMVLNSKLDFSSKIGSNNVEQLDPSKFAFYEEIKDLPNNPAKLLIDVREPKELEETGRIPTAINIPVKQVPEVLSHTFSSEKFKELFNRDKPSVDSEIIVHCKIGVRSQNITDLLYQLGYKNVKNYKGSWLEWAEKEGLNK